MLGDGEDQPAAGPRGAAHLEGRRLGAVDLLDHGEADEGEDEDPIPRRGAPAAGGARPVCRGEGGGGVKAALHAVSLRLVTNPRATATKKACETQLQRDHGRNSISTSVVCGGTTTPR